MEKQGKPKNKILKFLPRAASAVAASFQNPTFSPGRDRRSEVNTNRFRANRGFSGPIISIIPDEARRKSSKNGGFETQEPTSPKVSCMGQIKHKKQIKKAKRATPPRPQESKPVTTTTTMFSSSSPPEQKNTNKHASAFMRIFTGVKPPRSNKNGGFADKPDGVVADDIEVPSLSQMKRFASGRNSLGDFDWTAQMSPVDKDILKYYSDEERGESDEEEEEMRIPFSAPMMVGGGVPLQPRKEINLWKRRTLSPPTPLQLNPLVKAN
ncbi:hypothetical protein ACB098_01G069300 [Castanea mollissima]|uniref:Syringolide-induced protein 14-1-1 n=1 Tax=Castanea mollissima TaxID=60419 RepID=A0A8J4RJJ6_9ROSI|nr:hypothetical protein CMV_005572 [Castanea mollissima]